MKEHYYLIGAGGVGSLLLPSLVMLAGKPDYITVIDGDKLEKKNLSRQLYNEEDIGLSKANACANRYGCSAVMGWYSSSSMEHSASDVLLVCVDNHPARMAALSACDRCGCRAIFAANETHSAEAFYYQTEWFGTNLDPRVMYPEIATDQTGDPRARAIGCTGEAQVANRQLVTANQMAGALLMHLLVVWVLESHKLEASVLPHLPHKLVSNLTRMESHKAIITQRNERTNP